MIVEGTTLPAGAKLDADVCVVGAGPAGIAIAGELSGRGIAVTVLESGGRRASLRGQLLLGGRSVGYPYPRLPLAAVSAFGGSSHRWGPYWHARPLDALDFEERPEVPGSGWPFPRAALVPYYVRAERLLGLEPFDYEAGTAERDASRLLPVRAGRLVLGELRHGHADYRRAYERLAAAGDVRVILGAHVGELLPGGADAVAGVRAWVAPRRAFTVRAKVTVLAAGGIGNARLLLLGNAAHPEGIGNRHDLVGRFFMEHLAVRSGVVALHDPALLARRDLFGVGATPGGGAAVRTLALSEEVVRAEGLLNTYVMLEPRPRAFAAEGVRSASAFARALRSQPLTARFPAQAARAALAAPAVARALAARRPEILVVRVQAEQAPSPDSRVTLEPAVNRFGIRKARLDWRIAEADRRSIRRTQELVGAELEAAGLGRLEDLLGDERPPLLVAGHYHHLGTTRMHPDPERGVVDAAGRVHGVDNLYVTGGSVFPTGGAANPTLTVVALALRLADELQRVLGAGGRPVQ